ncbi:MAG: hypothetical protein A4E66_00406 [Syntrophus sp. PtaB.Bin001]|nr:MAG: hypothetical protein A4E66_00406 [Syntrophus sp. PtaB.Bin001]
MKKIATILIAAFMVTGLTTSAFAFGPDWGDRGRNDRHGEYSRSWHDNYRGHDQGRPHYDRHNYDRHHRVPSHESGAMISLPLVPLPGVSHLFPSINFNIR